MSDYLITYERKLQTKTCTIGTYTFNDKKLCDVLEPPEFGTPHRMFPAIYEIVFHEQSRFFEAPFFYKQIFSDIHHDGMLHILSDIPYTLMHCGNFAKDTQGCHLLGIWDGKSEAVGSSKETYRKVYPLFRDILKSGDKLFIEILQANVRSL